VTRLCSFLKSSIGLKILMAVSGTGLCLFLLAHMAGNLLVLYSYEAYNNYAHTLTSNKILLYTAEAGLIAVVLLHIVVAIALVRKNRAARRIPYQVKTNSGKSRRSWFSSNMIITGGFVLFFIPYHLWHFKYGEQPPIVQGGIEMHDLSSLVKAEFSEIGQVILYVIAMLVIGFHLLHGVRSLFATLGAETNRTARFVYLVSRGFVFVVMGGFAIIPIILFIRAVMNS